MTESFTTALSGIPALGLRSNDVELLCAPTLGGRVFSLRHRRSGREWLWRRREGPPLFPAQDPTDFLTGTFAGLDECLPSIGACTWVDGRQIPDHGTLWARPWSVDSHSAEGITLTAECPAFGLRLRRTVTLEAGLVHFGYQLENHGATEAPALWSMHPLFTWVEGDRLELDPGVRALWVQGARPALATTGPDRRVPYPEIAPGVRLDAGALADVTDGYLKAFAPEADQAVGLAALHHPATGDRLAIRWDALANPFLGIWLTRGGFQGWHHLALEPTNAPFDRVDLAAADGRCAEAVRLAPGARREWWVDWSVS